MREKYNLALIFSRMEILKNNSPILKVKFTIKYYLRTYLLIILGINNITAYHGSIKTDEDIWLMYELGGKPLTKQLYN